MTNNLDKTVIIGIGHSSLYPNASSGRITDGTLLGLARKDNGFNIQKQAILEYGYCEQLAQMIKDELKLININALTSNRYKYADINGESSLERDMGSEISAVNNYIDTHEGEVACALNLHLNSYNDKSANGFEYYSSSDSGAILLGKILSTKIISSLGIRMRGSKISGPQTNNLPGMSWCRSLRAPSILLELFFVSNPNDLRSGLSNKIKLAREIASGIKDFLSGEVPLFDIEKVKGESYVKSSSLIKDKLKPTITDNDIKTVAIKTQEKLLPIERQLGEGGDKYNYYVKNQVEVIGSAPSTLTPSIADNKANVYNKLVVREGGVVNEQKTYPSFQNVDIASDIPVGNKFLNVSNIYDIKSYENRTTSVGQTIITSGTTTSIIAGQQVDVSSAYNINITSGEVVLVNSPTVIISNDIIVNNKVNAKNIIASGNIYADGSLSAPSFNGPAVIDETNSQELYGYSSADKIVVDVEGSLDTVEQGKLTITKGKLTISNFNSGVGEGGRAITKIPEHSHFFKRLSGALSNNLTEVQLQIGPQINS